jgi:drug/metabolite transporter (DMT)-like permease
VQKSFYWTLLGATFFMGASFVASKILLKTIPPFTLVGWRFLVASMATLPIIYITRQSFKGILISEWRKVAIIGLLQTAGTMGLLFLSMLYISAATSAVLLFTNPIWVAALSPIILREKIRPPQYFGFLLGILGVILLIGINAEGLEMRGNLLGLGSSFCWSMATIYAKKSQVKVPPFVLSFGQMLVGSLVLITMSFIMNEHYDPINAGSVLDASGWFWFLWLAIPSSTGSFGLWYLALSKGGALKASSFLFLAPLFTVILSVFILKTSINIQQLLGAILVGLALYIVNVVRNSSSA